MKLLFDQNLSFKLCTRLSDLFPGSSQARLLGLSTASDQALWRRALSDGYILVTFDADFAELAALNRPPPKVIWLRRGNQSTDAVERLLRDRHEVIQDFEHDQHAACLELL